MSSKVLPPNECQAAETKIQPATAQKTKKIVIRSTQLIMVVLLAIALVNIIDSDVTTFILGKGTLRGYILDDNNAPVSAKVFVEYMNTNAITDQNGYFEIRGIPVGDQKIVITWLNAGFEAPVEIHRGGITDLGIIHVPTHLRSGHDVPRLEWR